MGKHTHTHTHTIPKHIIKNKKEPSTLIRVIRKNKNLPKEWRERERERENSHFCVGKK